MAEPIIKSMLDDDLYKLTMGQAIHACYPRAIATYQFTNRGGNTFSPLFFDKFQEQVQLMAELALTKEEANFLGTMRFINPQYIEWLRNYRYDPSEVDAYLNNGELCIKIRGPWYRTVMWEVKLMALISELYFLYDDIKWSIDHQYERATKKAERLAAEDCVFTDFGTRRRRSQLTQAMVVEAMSSSSARKSGHFVGTSNVALAMQFGLKAIGTVAHEWFMGISVLESLRHANRFGMDKWQEVYKGDLGTVLTDTYGTEAFLRDFDLSRAKLWDGARQDSGKPNWYTDLMVGHYRGLEIDPMSKYIVYSNALDDERAINIRRYNEKKIPARFGIGTFLTNDFEGSKPLNMVIKLRTMNGVEAVKLSDDADKATGDEMAVTVAKWTHGLLK